MTTIRKVGRTRLPKAQLRVLKAAKKARDKKLHWWFLAYYHDMAIWRKLIERGYAKNEVVVNEIGYYIWSYSITDKGLRELNG